jgi:hypothetical protein
MGSPVTRKGWIGLIAALRSITLAVALLMLGSIRWSAATVVGARSANYRANWTEAAATAGRVLDRRPDDPEALRLRARGLARLGRGGEAFALDCRLGGERLQAENLFLLAQTLGREGRTILAKAALYAASKLDPNHGETIGSLVAMRHGKGVSASVADRSDRLDAVPSGAALAELVIGLASIKGDAESALDHVLHRDRASFLRIKRPSEARKLLARLNLDAGHGGDALGILDLVVDGADLERNRLLSRAFLVLGDLPKARDALSFAGDFGHENPTAHEPSRYVGSRQCTEFHKEIYQTQQHSGHASTISWGVAVASVPLPKGQVKDPEAPTATHRFERSGDQVRVSADVDGKSLLAWVDYVVSSGRHGMTMISGEESGLHRSLRISYYSGGDFWGLTSGFEPHPDPHRAYIGEALSEESFRNCLNCHTTRFTSERERRRNGPEIADRGIGCERCHGPADHHLRAVASDFPEPAIARPRLATPAQLLNLCGQCRGPDGVIPPRTHGSSGFKPRTCPTAAA